MKLLVFKLNHLGDNVVLLPGLQALRARFPDWQLTIITTPELRALYTPLAPAERIWTEEKLRFDKCWRRPWELATWFARVRALRPDACLISFDQANIPHLLARHSGARVRVGGNLQHIRLQGTLTHEVPMPTSTSPAEWNWELCRVLARELGGADLAALPPAPDLSHLVSPTAPRSGRPRVVVHAGASRPFTRWPEENFAAVARRLAADCEVIWITRPEVVAPSPAGTRAVATRTLADFASLVANADLFLGNNSGPMHMANALGCPGVVVTGATGMGWNPYWHRERWAVLRHPRLECAPCERTNKVTLTCANLSAPFACLASWTVDAVEAVCREVLAQPRGPHHA